MPRIRFATACLAVLFGLSLGATGCGGSGSKPGHKQTAKPTHTQTHAQTKTATGTQIAPQTAVAGVKAWLHAVTARDCKTVASLTYGPLPRARCLALLKLTPAPTLGGVGAYGPLVVADLYLRGSRHAAAIFVLHGSTWLHATTFGTLRGILGTRELNTIAARSMLENVLPAIAHGSCTSVQSDFLAPPSRAIKRLAAKAGSAGGTATLPTAGDCFGLVGTQFQKELKRGIGSPLLLGGNARIVVYSVRAGKGGPYRYLVIVLARRGVPILFRIYLASAPAAGVSKRLKKR